MGRVVETNINFSVFEDETEYLGVAEASLPELSNMTTEVTGAGIPGKYESVVMGHTEAMSLTLNFHTLTKQAVSLHEQRNHQIELRVPQQERDTTTGRLIVVDVKHVFVLQPKKLNPGKASVGTTADASGEYSVFYWATYINGKKTLEIDMLNFIYNVNGKDYLAEVRKSLGK